MSEQMTDYCTTQFAAEYLDQVRQNMGGSPFVVRAVSTTSWKTTQGVVTRDILFGQALQSKSRPEIWGEHLWFAQGQQDVADRPLDHWQPYGVVICRGETHSLRALLDSQNSWSKMVLGMKIMSDNETKSCDFRALEKESPIVTGLQIGSPKQVKLEYNRDPVFPDANDEITSLTICER